jgi:hypothetical protein
MALSRKRRKRFRAGSPARVALHNRPRGRLVALPRRSARSQRATRRPGKEIHVIRPRRPAREQLFQGQSAVRRPAPRDGATSESSRTPTPSATTTRSATARPPSSGSTSSRLINPTGRAWPCERQAAPRWTPWAKSHAWPARQLSSLRTSARNIRPFTTRRFLRMPTATNSKFVSGKLRPRTPLVEVCPSPQLATLAEFILSEGAKRRSRRARDDKAGVRCAQGDNVARSLRTNSAA